MTLLELLVQELPKRGGWPQWAAGCGQSELMVATFVGDDYTLRRRPDGAYVCSYGNSRTDESDFMMSRYASDYKNRIVTREEYERAAAIKATEDMVKATIRQLTEAVTMKSDEVNDTGETITLHFPAGYHIPADLRIPEGYDVKSTTISEEPSEPSEYLVAAHGKVFTVSPRLTPLQRIEQLRKARDEAVRAYNDAFVSGEAELRKLKLGDKVMFEDRESAWTLVEIREHGSMCCNMIVRFYTFGHGCHRREYSISSDKSYTVPNVRFAPL